VYGAPVRLTDFQQISKTRSLCTGRMSIKKATAERKQQSRRSFTREFKAEFIDLSARRPIGRTGSEGLRSEAALRMPGKVENKAGRV
jgi:hypothetical protein